MKAEVGQIYKKKFTNKIVIVVDLNSNWNPRVLTFRILSIEDRFQKVEMYETYFLNNFILI